VGAFYKLGREKTTDWTRYYKSGETMENLVEQVNGIKGTESFDTGERYPAGKPAQSGKKTRFGTFHARKTDRHLLTRCSRSEGGNGDVDRNYTYQKDGWNLPLKSKVFRGALRVKEHQKKGLREKWDHKGGTAYVWKSPQIERGRRDRWGEKIGSSRPKRARRN